LKQFLTYLVEQTLAGNADALKEYTIGIDVFDRREDFDPKLDSIVRAQATRLRAKLAEYYAQQQVPGPVTITLPKRGYVPEFVPNDAGPAAIERTEPAHLPPRNRRYWVSAGILIASVIAIAAWLLSARQPRTLELRIVRLTSLARTIAAPAISPDGRLIAYVSDEAEPGNLDLYVQQIGGQPLRLTHSKTSESLPDFSPDGTSIVFQRFTGTWELFTIPTLGGAERRIGVGMEARYSPDGKSIAYTTPVLKSEVWVVPAGGGEPRRVGASMWTAMLPTWSPDGSRLIVEGFRKPGPPEKEFDFWVVPVGGGEPVRTGLYSALKSAVGPDPLEIFGPAHWDSEYLYLHGGQRTVGNVYRVPIAPGSSKPEGGLTRLTNGAQRIGHLRKAGDRMVFSSPVYSTDIYAAALSADGTQTQGQIAPATSEVGVTGYPVLSPGGEKLAYTVMRSGNNQDVWVADLGSGQAQAVIGTPGSEIPLGFSPDANHLAYHRMDAAYSIPVEGGRERKICAKCCAFDLSGDWKRMVTCPSQGQSALVVRDLVSQTEIPVVDLRGQRLAGYRLSPDGRWLAFFTAPDTSVGSSMYLVAVPTAGFGAKAAVVEQLRPVEVDNAEISALAWSSKGDKIYFRSKRDGYPCIWMIALDRKSMRPSAPAQELLHLQTGLGAIGRIPLVSRFNDMSVSANRIAFRHQQGTSTVWIAELH
jgi:Tol biopolymer transport system component